MEQVQTTRLDLDKVEAEISKLFNEAVKLQAETAKLNAETMKLSAESAKLQRERYWYPVVVATTLTAAVIGATAALTKLLIGS